MNILSIALALWLTTLTPSPALPAATPNGGSVTMLEGALRVIRGASVVKGVEGMHLRQGDILETSDNGFAQLEIAGGIIALGPATHVLVFRQAGDKSQQSELVLLSGWLKGESTAAPSFR